MAIIETVVAMGAAVWVGNTYGWHLLLWPVCIALFLLLRTEESVKDGLEWFRSIDTRLGVSKASRTLTGDSCLLALGYLLLMPFIVTLCALSSRLAATVRCVARFPVRSLTAVSGNWHVQAACVDVFTTIEVVPGAEKYFFENSISKEEMLSVGSTSLLLTLLKEDELEDGGNSAIIVFIWLSPVFLSAVLYRLSLKSTAIVWLPILWVVPRIKPSASLIIRLKLITQSSWGRLVFALSVMAITGFIAKTLLYNGSIILLPEFFDGQLGKFLTDYVAPESIPWWQISSTVNSVIAIALFFWAGHALIKMEDVESTESPVVDVAFRTASVVRALLSLYTSSCLIYLTIIRARLLEWPPLGERLFPWM